MSLQIKNESKRHVIAASADLCKKSNDIALRQNNLFLMFVSYIVLASEVQCRRYLGKDNLENSLHLPARWQLQFFYAVYVCCRHSVVTLICQPSHCVTTDYDE